MGKMALSAKCLQFLFVIFDGIFFISAFAVIILNCAFLYKVLSYNAYVDSSIILPCILMVVIGILSLFFAWVGWKSAWNLHRLHIIMFGICLLLVVLTELGFSIWSLVIRDNMEAQINSAMELDFRSMMNKTESDEYLTKRWDKMQRDLQCCGIGGPSDYRTGKSIPWSCCIASSKAVEVSQMHFGDCGTIYQRGCFGPLYQVARDVMLYVCLTCLGAGLIQAFGLLCAYYLQVAISRPLTVLVSQTVEQPTTSTRRRAPQPPKGAASRALLSPSNERY